MKKLVCLLAMCFYCLSLSQIANAKECSNLSAGLENAFPNLPSVPYPTALKQASKDTSFWAIVLRDGEILVFENDPKVKKYKTLLDIKSKVDVRLEMGMTGAAFHPDYPSDKRLFVVYNNVKKKGQSTVSSFIVDPKSHVASAQSEKVLLTLDQQAQNHNGGDITFGPDKMLYIGFGDGGYDMATSQDLNNLYGSIIRIDVSQSPYGIPNDNPFNKGQNLCSSGSGKEKCPEIFAYGLRNPWRISFDLKTGDLWTADVGEDSFEEVNRIQKGANYGWPIMEGGSCFDNKPCSKKGLALPISGYDYDGPQSIVGGYVYRGKLSPALDGKYIFGDTFSSQYYSIEANAKEGSSYKEIFHGGRKVASLAQDTDGEVYLLNFEADFGDLIYRIVAQCK